MREFSQRRDYKAHLIPVWMPSLQRIMVLLSHGLTPYLMVEME